VPVLSSIVHTPQEKENRAMRSDFFLGIWDDYFPLQEAERQLATTVDWG
jgi:NitT/TauT family transport system ATP-binding protein